VPQQKDLKRIVRSRMEKTGESYTAARRHVVSKKTPSPAPSPPPDYSALAGMAEATIKARTGRGWGEWVELLDAFGAAEKPHRDAAAYVFSLGVDGWWAQSVTVGYERIRGLRERGQRRGGAYEASKSKTVAVPVETLFDAFANARTRKRWLGEVKLKIRTATRAKSMRITWDDGTSVDLWFQAKGPAKSAVGIQHVKLTSRDDIQRRKQFWSEKLDALAKLLAK